MNHEYSKGDPKITVAVLDTGVDLDHPELTDALLPGHDCAPRKAQSPLMPWHRSVGIGNPSIAKRKCSWLTAVVTPLLFTVGVLNSASADSYVHEWKGEFTVNDAWKGEALFHQKRLTLDVPLSEASFYGTHNNYNSDAYANKYIDTNQNIWLGERPEARIIWEEQHGS